MNNRETARALWKMSPARRALFLHFGGKKKVTTDIAVDGTVIGYKFNSEAVELGIWEPPIFTGWACEGEGKTHFYINGNSICRNETLSSNRAEFYTNLTLADNACKRCWKKL